MEDASAVHACVPRQTRSLDRTSLTTAGKVITDDDQAITGDG
ncbi:MAG: hypothetical protein OXP09_11520 [Gammaproteobacteria bacterium]|nr:hypothetical protein [Gammaproteobacteria bacterium]MDE0366189.1 hypothetical protein [Gammaproteobacteria bacterium]